MRNKVRIKYIIRTACQEGSFWEYHDTDYSMIEIIAHDSNVLEGDILWKREDERDWHNGYDYKYLMTEYAKRDSA